MTGDPSNPITNLDERISLGDSDESESVADGNEDSSGINKSEAETDPRVNKKRQRHASENEDLCAILVQMMDQVKKLRQVKSKLLDFKGTMNHRMTIDEMKPIISGMDSIHNAAVILDQNMALITADMLDKGDYHNSYQPKFAEEFRAGQCFVAVEESQPPLQPDRLVHIPFDFDNGNIEEASMRKVPLCFTGLKRIDGLHLSLSANTSLTWTPFRHIQQTSLIHDGPGDLKEGFQLCVICSARKDLYDNWKYLTLKGTRKSEGDTGNFHHLLWTRENSQNYLYHTDDCRVLLSRNTEKPIKQVLKYEIMSKGSKWRPCLACHSRSNA